MEATVGAKCEERTRDPDPRWLECAAHYFHQLLTLGASSPGNDTLVMDDVPFQLGQILQVGCHIFSVPNDNVMVLRRQS